MWPSSFESDIILPLANHRWPNNERMAVTDRGGTTHFHFRNGYFRRVQISWGHKSKRSGITYVAQQQRSAPHTSPWDVHEAPDGPHWAVQWERLGACDWAEGNRGPPPHRSESPRHPALPRQENNDTRGLQGRGLGALTFTISIVQSLLFLLIVLASTVTPRLLLRAVLAVGHQRVTDDLPSANVNVPFSVWLFSAWLLPLIYSLPTQSQRKPPIIISAWIQKSIRLNLEWHPLTPTSQGWTWPQWPTGDPRLLTALGRFCWGWGRPELGPPRPHDTPATSWGHPGWWCAEYHLVQMRCPAPCMECKCPPQGRSWNGREYAPTGETKTPIKPHLTSYNLTECFSSASHKEVRTKRTDVKFMGLGFD